MLFRTAGVAFLAFASLSLASPAFAPFATQPLPSGCPTTPAPRVPAPPQFHCNQQGTLTSNSYLTRFLSETQDYVPCYDACLADVRCISFSFNTANNYCRTFGRSLNSKGFAPSSISPLRVWNLKGCFTIDPACSATSTSTTPTSSTTLPTPPAAPIYVVDPGFDAVSMQQVCTCAYQQICYCAVDPDWTFGVNDRDISSFETKYNVQSEQDQIGHGEWLVRLAGNPYTTLPIISQTLHGLSTTQQYTLSIEHYETQTSLNDCHLLMTLDQTVIVDEVLDPNVDHTWTTTTPVTFSPPSTDPSLSISFACSGTSGAYFITLVDNVNFQVVGTTTSASTF